MMRFEITIFNDPLVNVRLQCCSVWFEPIQADVIVIGDHFIYPLNNGPIQPVHFKDYLPFYLVFPKAIKSSHLVTKQTIVFIFSL